MRPIADCLPFVLHIDSSPGKTKSNKTYAPHPVWAGSTTGTVKFVPLPKAEAVKLYAKAEEFERQTRKPGYQDGALGRNGLAILRALLFYFLSYHTGRLDPSQKAIAKRANISERSVTRGLAKLKAAGVLNWIRRAEIVRDEKGRFSPKQNTNAYAVLPSSHWKGFVESKPTPPLPHPSEWGAVSPQPDLIEQAIAERQQGAWKTALALLQTDPADTLAGALARYWQTLEMQQNRH